MSSYAELTYRARNPLKRIVHANRFGPLLRVVPLHSHSRVLDYGCGDGYFLRTAERAANPALLVGYEPDAAMRAQATGTTARMVSDVSEIPAVGYTHIFCQEVLEHLAEASLAELFTRIKALATPETLIVFTVPIEHGPSGFAKNLYRSRSQPVTFAEAARSLFGLPISREISETPFGPYIFRHTGFDVRAMERELRTSFAVERTHNDPFESLPMGLNNSRVIVCKAR